MFPRKHRLAKTKDIETVQKSGRSFFTKLFILKFAENSLNYSRFTVVVSNKVAKSAVIRNKVKRLIRESLQSKKTNIRPGYDILVSVSKNITDKEGGINKPEILKTIDFALEKSGLLKK